MISNYRKLLLAGTSGILLSAMPYATTFAQDSVDTTLIGLNPILSVSCENTANDIIVPGIPVTQNTWSCMDPHLTSTPGDTIHITVEGVSSDTLLVGGRTQGLESITSVTCENHDTQQSVVFRGQGIGWDCVANGLRVTPGDSITQQVTGIIAAPVIPEPPCEPGVEGQPCEEPPPSPCDPLGVNGQPCEPPLPCDPAGIDGQPCEPPRSCDPGAAGVDGNPCEPRVPCDPAGVDGIPCEPPVPCDPIVGCEPPPVPCGIDGRLCPE